MRANALQSLGKLKSANAYGVLTAAVQTESPDGMLRDIALGALGSLGDDRAVPLLREWAGGGQAAGGALRGDRQLGLSR